MIAPIILLVFSLIMDGILTNFLPYGVGNLSLFTPATTIVALIIIYIFYYHKDKNYLITCAVCGIIYDLLYTNLVFLDALIFTFIGYLVIQGYKNTGFNYMWVFIYVLLGIILYETSFAVVIAIFNLVPMTLDRLLYKISHTLLFNLIYGEILYLIVGIIPKKYKKIRIN